MSPEEGRRKAYPGENVTLKDGADLGIAGGKTRQNFEGVTMKAPECQGSRESAIGRS